MKRMLALFLGLLCLMACVGGVAETRAEMIPAVIDAGNSDRVHLRAKPSTSAESRGLYYTGTALVCESDPAQEWVRVAIGTQDGYMKSEYLRWGEAMAGVQARQPIGVIRTNGWVNMRSKPDKAAEQAAKLYNGATLTIFGETSTHWYYGSTDASIGYVMAKYVTVTDGTSASRPASPSTPATYQAVLMGRAPLINAYDQRSLYFSQLGSVIEGLPVQFTQFATADVDSDGAPEVIVKIMVDGNVYGYEVLDSRGGSVYGYDLVYRAFQEPKADGTASYASSAFETGFGTLVLGQTLCSYSSVAYSEADASGTVRYYHLGTAITADAYDQLLTAQNAKPSVAWYDLTNTNVAKYLGA